MCTCVCMCESGFQGDSVRTDWRPVLTELGSRDSALFRLPKWREEGMEEFRPHLSLKVPVTLEMAALSS